MNKPEEWDLFSIVLDPKVANEYDLPEVIVGGLGPIGQSTEGARRAIWYEGRVFDLAFEAIVKKQRLEDAD